MPDDDNNNKLLDLDLPPRYQLVASDKRVYDRAWTLAYPILWRRGLGFVKMKGVSIPQDREDLVARSIEKFRLALLRGMEADAALDEFILNEEDESGD